MHEGKRSIACEGEAGFIKE